MSLFSQKNLFTFILIGIISTVSYFGCSDNGGPVTPTFIANPNVKTFDSIGVEEDSIIASSSGINLTTGMNTPSDSSARDCSLNDAMNAGVNFYLQDGVLDNSLPAGYEIRFFRVSDNMTASEFDTLSKIHSEAVLDSTDFTQNSTEFWGYFNAPLTSTPVYCFYLKGRRPTSTKPIYGIIQPREATDRTPSAVYGFRMSFRVRINTNGENDFRKLIQTN